MTRSETTPQSDGATRHRSLLQRVRDALLVSPLPTALNFSATTPTPLPTAASPDATLDRTPQSAAAESNRLTDAYLSKLYKTKAELASARAEEKKRRDQEERDRLEAARREALKEKLMEEVAHEWTKVIIPQWNTPKAKARAKELVLRSGVPPLLRGTVWPLAIGNSLMINKKLYEAFYQRAHTVKDKHAKVRAAQLDTFTASVNNTNHSDRSVTAAPTSSTVMPSTSSNARQSSVALPSAPSFSSASGGGTIPFLFGAESSFIDIDVDLHRTFPQLAFFQAGCDMKDELRSILYTFCFYRPDVGYVQGMSYLAAFLLITLTQTHKTFICFANLINSNYFYTFLKMNNKRMNERYNLYLIILNDYCPNINSLLQTHGITPDMYALEWFMTLFCKKLNLDTVARVWDCYVLCGESIVYRVAVAIMMCLKEPLMAASNEMSLLMKGITTMPMELNETTLFDAVNRITWSNKYEMKLQTIQQATDDE